jgi:hypothetical protein
MCLLFMTFRLAVGISQNLSSNGYWGVCPQGKAAAHLNAEVGTECKATPDTCVVLQHTANCTVTTDVLHSDGSLLIHFVAV